MPLRARRFSIVVLICLVSLGTNVFLAWQWQSERDSLRSLLASKETQLRSTFFKNRKLSRENVSLGQDLSSKDKELAKRQDELNTLAKQLEEKKKELESKQSELTVAQKRIDDQKSQLDANSTELVKLRNRPPLFSFQVKSTAIANVEAKKEAVKQVVTAAYDVIEELYSKAYLLKSVTITFVDKFNNEKASGEIVLTNSDKGLELDIHLKDFDRNSFSDVNTIIHEVMHAFHGLAVFEPTAFEEGIVVAATDAVMAKMIAAGALPKFSPLYIRLSESEWQQKQSSLAIPRDANAFYGSDEVGDYYQVLGKAWYKLYEADSQFFSKFNESIYQKKQAGQEITETLVLDTVRQVAPQASLTGAAWQLK